MRSTVVIKRQLTIFFVLLATSFCSSLQTTAWGQPIEWDGGVSGVLLVGGFRSQQDLNKMSNEEQRNTLITELANRTRDSAASYQSLNHSALAGAGALLVYLRGTGSRTDAQIKTMSADDMRNTVIVEVSQGGNSVNELQGYDNMDIMKKVVLEHPTKFLH